ncbi:PREDICTED: aladin [Ceratosolen solmsi marchali]|uniref:Aladin n=1 Tax=Ceratosolen solmsi marchali TaxID=326594 RepID=A0AAJ6YVT1_9HYME|nr:PREDICTED: aladin [Ceratosolen solmsi marchali]
MLKILSLQDFSFPSSDNLITASFMYDEPVYCTKEELQQEIQSFATYLHDFPVINITPEMLATRETARTIGARDLFLPVQDSSFKKIANIWREKGLLEAIRAAAAESPIEITYQVHWLATRMTQILDVIERGTFWSKVLPISGFGSVADVISTRDWTTALIRCMAWHPHCIRLAIATRDDRIRIFSIGNIGTAVLRHSAQKSVCCLSWRPNAGRELAAACQNGVLIWTVELGAASNSLSYAYTLKYRNHAPVTSVSWNPQGDLLVSCSLTDMNMIIWDVAKESGIPLRRLGGGGLCFTHWSPCGSRLLATTCRKIFRVWDIGAGTSWKSERWTVPNGRVAAACFGPNLTLLFTSTEDPSMVYSLPLQEQIFDVKKVGTLDDNKVAIPLIDLSKVTFPINDEDEYSVGGRVTSMDWDPLGKYLAIIFQDSSLVAIFKTKIGATSRITKVEPLCFVKGFPGEVPNCIQFYQNCQEGTDSTILTIAWSNGFIQHFPIVDGAYKESNLNHSKNVGIMSNTFSITEDLQTSLYSSFSYIQ